MKKRTKKAAAKPKPGAKRLAKKVAAKAPVAKAAVAKKPAAKKAPKSSRPAPAITEELIAVLLGANEAAKWAGARAARKFFHHRAGGLKAQSPKHLDAILTALLQQRRVSVRYPGHMQDEPAVLEPLTLMLHKDALYLLAQPVTYPEVYALAVGRILDIQVLAEEFAYPQEWNAAEHYKSPFGLREGDESVAVLRCAPPLVRALRERAYGDLTIEELPDGHGRLTIRTQINEEFKAWILSYGEQLEVISPPDLRANIAARLTEAAAPYERAAKAQA